MEYFELAFMNFPQFLVFHGNCMVGIILRGYLTIGTVNFPKYPVSFHCNNTKNLVKKRHLIIRNIRDTIFLLQKFKIFLPLRHYPPPPPSSLIAIGTISPHNVWTKIALFFGKYCNKQVKIPTDNL